ncbi:hypothetical protein [Corynebacterium sp.]|uniref:hypothetical protein n=1 Tax=Corynebacterium sp. TaxID=1720 RepID=UPI0025C3B8D8|nr:hypothetical protein [Corynebacterium sp.]
MTKKIIAAAALAATAATLTSCAAMNQQDITCTVEDKEAKDKTWFVFTDDCGTLTVEDSISKWKFDATDRYDSIEVGKTYTFHVGGYRNHALSTYPNILEVTPVD